LPGNGCVDLVGRCQINACNPYHDNHGSHFCSWQPAGRPAIKQENGQAKGPSAGNTNKDGKGKESKDIGSSGSSPDVCLRVMAEEMKQRC